MDESSAAGIEVVDPGWEPWSPAEVARRLADVGAAWCVAAGWALDLWRGRQTREHEDIEIAVPAAGFPEIRQALAGYEFDVIGAGRRWPVDSPAFDRTYQTWVREPATGVYRLDVFREPHDGDVWICRRDPAIRLPYPWVIHRTPDGIPYLAPEVALLFKAKATRPKDEADFTGALPMLGAGRRAWLREALARVAPAHEWAGRV